MKVLTENAILHIYINKAQNSFRLLEKSQLTIFLWRNPSMITFLGSTDFSTEVSEFTQGRKYGLEALQSQSLAVFQKHCSLYHDVNIHE